MEVTLGASETIRWRPFFVTRAIEALILVADGAGHNRNAVAQLPAAHPFGILPDVYSALVLDHFKNPRNVGELPDATATVEVSNPVCGDILQISVRVEASRVTAARFKARGCVTAIACASLLTEMMQGKTAAELRAITSESLAEALGGLPPATVHGSQLARDALAAILSKLP